MPSKILIIEDDSDIRRHLKRLLESEGYTVEQAENGQAALDLLALSTALPSMIILDLMMPVMDGFEFRERQQLDPRLSKIPILVMTADGRLDEKKLRVGARAALKKPADVDAILALVKEVSENP
jgi:CheY-like chemotaxis protein